MFQRKIHHIILHVAWCDVIANKAIKPALPFLYLRTYMPAFRFAINFSPSSNPSS